jgi:transposase-like protein
VDVIASIEMFYNSTPWHSYLGYRSPNDYAALRIIDAIYEPLRRWGSRTGVLYVWGICVDGCKVLLSLSTVHSASDESCLEVLRDLITRGLPTPVTITTEGAPGLTKAVDFVWSRSLRIRCWFHKMQNLAAHVRPQAWPAFKVLVVDRRDAPSVEEGPRRFQFRLAQYQHTYLTSQVGHVGKRLYVSLVAYAWQAMNG